MEVLDVVANRFGKSSKDDIIEIMHNEDSYKKTAKKEIILYKYANTLSLSWKAI